MTRRQHITNNQATVPVSSLSVLEAAKPSLLVRRLVSRDDGLTAALFDLAMGDQAEWTVGQLKRLQRQLISSDMCLGDWLILNT